MSKELEALKVLGGYYYHEQGFDDHARDSMEYKIIETALKKLEKIETTTHSVLREDISKNLEALEIIKKWILRDLVFDDETQAINYSFGLYTLVKVIKDKSDYDLLKEAFKQ